MNDYVCKNCGIVKEGFYYLRKDKKDNIYRSCKKCSLKHSKNYQKKNNEKYKEKSKKRRAIDDGLFGIYLGMIARCNRKTSTGYKYYGGKGVCVEWNSYQDFKKDMYFTYIEHINKYSKKDTSIDRINSCGNYSKENCRWATKKEQYENRKIKIKPKLKIYKFNNSITYPIYLH